MRPLPWGGRCSETSNKQMKLFVSPRLVFVLCRIRCVHLHPRQRHRYVPAARLQQRSGRTRSVQDEGRSRASLLRLPGQSRPTGSHSGPRSAVAGRVLRAAQTADSHHSVRRHAGGPEPRRRHPWRWEVTSFLKLHTFVTLGLRRNLELSSADKEAHGPNMFSPRSKTWTFPNLKTPAGPAEVYLAVEEEEEEAVSFGSPFRGVR